MPKIEIKERDLTSAGNLEVTTNAVYIPGYSNMGPVNTPILCETLSDFQAVFGAEPYKFRADQKWDFDDNQWKDFALSPSMGLFYQEGEYEKSYIMAVELLRLGLPVLYERVFNKGATCYVGKNAKKYHTPDFGVSGMNIIKEANNGTVVGLQYVTDENSYSWTASAKNEDHMFVAVAPGLASELIYYTVQESNIEIDGVNTKYYKVQVGRSADASKGVGEISPVTSYYTFDPKLPLTMESATYLSDNTSVVDNSGLITIYVGTSKKFTVSNTDAEGQLIATSLALPSGVDKTTDEFNVSDIYAYLQESGNDAEGNPKGYDRLLDNGEYVIKFITSGAYPAFEYGSSNTIANLMMETAANRGNATALIDHTPNNVRGLQVTNTASVYSQVTTNWAHVNKVSKLGEDCNTFAAMFTPYGIYSCASVAKDVMLPASFGYLAAYAAQVQQYNGWLATAGVTRGLVPNLKSLCQNITNAVADSYQPRDGIAINAITNIKPYGLTIWGARTLKNNAKKGDLTATSFLNIRQLTNDVKRTTWVSAKILTYEQNNDMLWIKFKLNIQPLLDQMISGSAISSYEFRRESTTKKATVKAAIRLYAIEPVEDWDITIELADSTTDIVG